MDSLNKKKRGSNITDEQRTLLIEYMKKHPQLTRGKFTSSFTLKHSIQLWNEITNILNAINGAKKDWKGWRKCWHDFQSRSKKKHSSIKQSMAATGGGMMNTESLTSQEEQVLNIMSSTSIHGHPAIEESPVHLLNIPEEDTIEVEYLDENEDDLLLQLRNDTDTNSNIVASEKKNNPHNENNFQDLMSEKENMNKTFKNYTDIPPCTSKNDKSVRESGYILSNTNSSIRSTENDNEKITPLKEKRSNTGKKQLKNVIEVSAHLNDIYKDTYELKKNYYEKKLEYLKRFVEVSEKISKTLEKWNF
ncbi:uncharacterized protein [Temnothorax nylanderi]|uniref:uncharacterized protein n=1 Tax=Temnothorax nylanderi TaxID=102681 RepID=UPI003A88732E